MFSNANDKPVFIKQIQQKLRDLQFYTTQRANIGVDGFYDEGTKNAVRAFQKQYGLNQTGLVDYTTWKKIDQVLALYYKFWDKAVPVSIFPNDPMRDLDIGEKSDIVMFLQLLLQELSQKYSFFENVKPSGTYDNATQDAVKRYQLANNLPASGSVDKPTWNMLATDFNYYPSNN